MVVGREIGCWWWERNRLLVVGKKAVGVGGGEKAVGKNQGGIR